MNLYYAKEVATPNFIGFPGTSPFLIMTPAQKPTPRERIHVKQFDKDSAQDALERFINDLHDKYEDMQIIETLEVDDYILLVFSIPRY